RVPGETLRGPEPEALALPAALRRGPALRALGFLSERLFDIEDHPFLKMSPHSAASGSPLPGGAYRRPMPGTMRARYASICSRVSWPTCTSRMIPRASTKTLVGRA